MPSSSPLRARAQRSPGGLCRRGVAPDAPWDARRLTEAQLVERARTGDEAAFRSLYDAHVDRVYRLTYRMAGEDQLARDFTQETFVRVHQRLGQFRGDSAFGTWLHAIAVSVSLNGLRRRRRTQEREVDLDEMELGYTPPQSGGEVRERLRQAIDGLPEIYRTVFLMHDLEGFNHQEIAAALDMAEGTSKARLSRARAKLRAALGGALEEYVG
jgi:RNA polymerase sigma-70 factor, ECF subfamily